MGGIDKRCLIGTKYEVAVVGGAILKTAGGKEGV